MNGYSYFDEYNEIKNIIKTVESLLTKNELIIEVYEELKTLANEFEAWLYDVSSEETDEFLSMHDKLTQLYFVLESRLSKDDSDYSSISKLRTSIKVIRTIMNSLPPTVLISLPLVQGDIELVERTFYDSKRICFRVSEEESRRLFNLSIILNSWKHGM